MLSVIIPYAEKGNLQQAVDSIPVQGNEYEIIVVATGPGSNATRSLNTDKRALKIIASAKAGTAAAMNTGLMAASGEYILYLDPYSIVGENYLPPMIAHLEKNNDCDACYGDHGLYDITAPFNKDKLVADKRYPLYSDGTRYAREHLANYFGGNYIPQGCIVWRKDFLLRRKGHNEELTSDYNTELFVRSIFNGLRITAIDDKALVYVNANDPENGCPASMLDTGHMRQVLKNRKKMFGDLKKYSFEEDELFLALSTYLFDCWKQLRHAEPELAIDFVEFAKRVCWPIPVSGGLSYRLLARLLGPVKATELLFP